MANPSVTYSFTNGTTADATQVNQNFTDLIAALTDGSKSLSIDAITAAGTATLNGNVILGNASGDTITVNGTWSGGIASGDTIGLVDNSAKTWKGVKTFDSAPVFSSATASTILAVDSGKSLTSVVYSTGNTVGSGAFTWSATTGNITEYDSAVRTIHWIRLVNTVFVTGAMAVSVTGSEGIRGFRITLPVSSNLSAAQSLSGVCTSDATSSSGIVYGDAGSDSAEFSISLQATSGIGVYFSFSYTVA